MKIDVPAGKVGIFISGGLDSAVLYHLILKENKNVVPLLILKNNEQYNRAWAVIQYLQTLHSIHNEPILLRSKDIRLAIREAIGQGFSLMYLGVIRELDDFLIGWEPNNFSDSEWVVGPLKGLDKSQIVHLAIINKVEHLFSITHSCAEQPIGRCNQCNRCRERAWGFSQLGLTDPGIM